MCVDLFRLVCEFDLWTGDVKLLLLELAGLISLVSFRGGGSGGPSMLLGNIPKSELDL